MRRLPPLVPAPFAAALLVFSLALAGTPLAAARAKSAPETAATGTFAKAGDEFVIGDGFAYEGTGYYGGETVIKVRLTGAKLDRKALEAALDQQGELARQTGEDSGAVTLDVALDAAWEGVAYRLPGGAVCGYCSSGAQAAQSHLRIEDGVVKGKIRTQPADAHDGDGLDVDLTLAVPITRPTGITALPAGGGEAGTWLETCRKAIAEPSREGLAKACSEPIAARLDSFEATEAEERAASFRGDLESTFPSLALPTIEITGGRSKGDQAELTLDGRKGNDHYRGSLFLRRTEGVWRVERDGVQQVWD